MRLLAYVRARAAFGAACWRLLNAVARVPYWTLGEGPCGIDSCGVAPGVVVVANAAAHTDGAAARQVLPWTEIEYGRPYHESLNQCEYKLYRFEVEDLPGTGGLRAGRCERRRLGRKPVLHVWHVGGAYAAGSGLAGGHIYDAAGLRSREPGKYFSTGAFPRTVIRSAAVTRPLIAAAWRCLRVTSVVAGCTSCFCLRAGRPFTSSRITAT